MRRSVLVLPQFLAVASLLLSLDSVSAQEPESVLKRAHAHNDYYHKRPLLDALEQGFCSVEADVFLRKQKLVVAHSFLEIKSDRTLEQLYLAPLFKRVAKNGGSVYRKTPAPFFLLVDFKTEGAPTLKAPHQARKRQSDSWCGHDCRIR